MPADANRSSATSLAPAETVFFGRDAELCELIVLLREAAEGRGAFVFVTGATGSGVSSLLGQLPGTAAADETASRIAFGTATCDPYTPFDPFQPFVGILDSLTRPDRASSAMSKRMVDVFKEIGPDLVMLIPGLGPILSSIVKISLKAAATASKQDDPRDSAARGITQLARALLSVASDETPLALVIDEAQYLDASSCGVLFRIASEARRRPLLVVVGYPEDTLTSDHPLKELHDTLVTGNNAASQIKLENFTEDEVRGYLQTRLGTPLPEHLAAWLFDRCKGNPFFTSHFVAALEGTNLLVREDGRAVLDGRLHRAGDGEWVITGKLESFAIPMPVETLLETRISQLPPDDRTLLKAASVEGSELRSGILATILDQPEPSLRQRLAVLGESHIIELRRGDPWWRKRSQIYSFDPRMMQTLFYDMLGDYDRYVYHRGIADALEKLVENEPNAPRRIRLEIARHYFQAEEYRLAARDYRALAESTFREGALYEASELCGRALDAMDLLDDSEPDDARLRAELTCLLVTSAEKRLRGKTELDERRIAERLITGAQAALETGDLALQARVELANAQTRLIREGLSASLENFENALGLARASGDAFVTFVVLLDYGHHQKSESLEDGVRTLREAFDLYDSGQLERAGVADGDLHWRVLRLERYMGVAEFDLGNYGKALESLQRIERYPGPTPLDTMANVAPFGGQLYTALGAYGPGAQILEQGIALYDEPEPNPFRAYNRGLLGKLLLDAGRVEDAARELEEAWRETQMAWNVSVALLVRNYYAELLLHPQYRPGDRGEALEEADAALTASLEDSRSAGFHRTAIGALALRAQLELVRDDVAAAVEASSEAVASLVDRGGAVPALRSEEVYFRHHEALTAAGRSEEAAEALRQACDFVDDKAKSIGDDEIRRSFRGEVPLNRAILAARSASVPSGH